ncbi:hypothetical protein ABPG77_003770 [Micractinium sp. CCAP 211/92]
MDDSTSLVQAEQAGASAGPAAGPAATGPAAQIRRLKYQGMAVSAYAAQPVQSSGVIQLACGFAYESELFRSNYVGVSPDVFSKGLACGRCIRVQCDDLACRPPGGSLVAQVVDLCGEGHSAQYRGTQAATGPPPQMSWDVVDCAPYISGTIKMYLKPGGSQYYQSFSFSNSIQPIIGVMINGVRLAPSTSSAYWVSGSCKRAEGEIDPRGRFEIVLAGASREFLRVRISPLRSQDLGVQFKPVAAAAAAGAPAPEQTEQRPAPTTAPAPAPAPKPGQAIADPASTAGAGKAPSPEVMEQDG